MTMDWIEQAGGRQVLSLLGAVLMATLLLLLIPLTQQGDEVPEATVDVRPVVTVLPPPPPPVEELEEPDVRIEPEILLDKPKPQPMTMDIELAPLSLSLNPGLGDSLAMGMTLSGFNTEVNVVEAMKDVFSFDELTEKPRLLRTPRMVFPKELTRRGINEGKVVVRVEISQEGRVRVKEVVSVSHPALRNLVVKEVERCRFSPPMREGVAVKAEYVWPIILQAPKRR